MSNKTAFESHSDGARRRKFPEQARTASRGDPANLGVNDGREAAAIARRKKIHGGFMSLIQLTAPPVTLGVGLEVSVLLASAVGWPLSSSTAASLCVAARIACSTFYLATGALHFLEKPFYLAIMPGWVPMHDEVIALTGVAELLAGFLMIRETNANFGAWLALLIVVAGAQACQRSLFDSSLPRLTRCALVLNDSLPCEHHTGVLATRASASRRRRRSAVVDHPRRAAYSVPTVVVDFAVHNHGLDGHPCCAPHCRKLGCMIANSWCVAQRVD